jgi:ATP-binding cassette, subfamily C, bacterial CydCD
VRPLDPRLLRYAGAVRPYLVATVALGVLTAGLVVAQAALLANAITAAFLHGADLSRLGPTLAGLAAIVVARAAISGGQEALARSTSVRVQAQLRNRLVRKVFELGPAWLAGQRTADLTLLATRGVRVLDGYFADYLPQLVLAGLIPVVVLACLLPADLVAFVIVLVTVPLVPVFLALVGLTTRERTQRQWASLQRLGHHFLDVVSGLTTLKIYGRARHQAEVVARVTDDYRRATMATLRLAFLSSLVLELLATLSVALVAVGVGLRLLAGHLDLRTALFVLILAPEAYLPLRRLGAAYHSSAEGLAAAESVFAVLDAPAPAAPPQRRYSGDAAKPVAALSIRELTVRREGRPGAVLEALDLDVAAGELVAVTGPSGVGKSTLLDAILGFAPLASGQIMTRTGDDRVRTFGEEPVADWRAQFAWVSQRPHVVAGTVADNVRLGAPHASDDEVARALTRAGDLLAELRFSAATRVGEGGAGLSVGQVRRLALARALVCGRPVLLLDEPTAGLDQATEARVVRTLVGRLPGQTVLVMTHRPALLAAADRVVTLQPMAVRAA